MVDLNYTKYFLLNVHKETKIDRINNIYIYYMFYHKL